MSKNNVQEVARSPEGTVGSEPVMESPIYYKKKVLPLYLCERLQGDAEECMEQNRQITIDEKAMLEKIEAKHDAFVARLEQKLEDYKKKKTRQIKLLEDDLPDWSIQPDSDAPRLDYPEYVRRLREWYQVMGRSVEIQQDAVHKVVGRWFHHIGEIKNQNEGETDVYIRKIEPTESLISSKYAEVELTTIILCGILVLACAIYVMSNPEDVSKCTEQPGKCMKREIMRLLVFIHDAYLRFHNITPEDCGIAAVNRSRLLSDLE